MPIMSSRTAAGAHILALLSTRGGEALASHEIAASVNTNPVVVRRIVGALRKAGLVHVRPGPSGGATLARRPDEITLLDVYRAVEGEPLFALPPRLPAADCTIGLAAQEAVLQVFDRAEAALEHALSGTTLAGLWTGTAEQSVTP